MKIQIIVGSIREGRIAIKVARWVQRSIERANFSTVQAELIDLKEWNLPIFSGAHPPITGIYDQPQQQEWADKIASGDAIIFISPEYNHGYSPALKNALDYLGKDGKANLLLILAMAQPMAHARLIKSVKSEPNLV